MNVLKWIFTKYKYGTPESVWLRECFLKPYFADISVKNTEISFKPLEISVETC